MSINLLSGMDIFQDPVQGSDRSEQYQELASRMREYQHRIGSLKHLIEYRTRGGLRIYTRGIISGDVVAFFQHMQHDPRCYQMFSKPIFSMDTTPAGIVEILGVRFDRVPSQRGVLSLQSTVELDRGSLDPTSRVSVNELGGVPRYSLTEDQNCMLKATTVTADELRRVVQGEVLHRELELLKKNLNLSLTVDMEAVESIKNQLMADIAENSEKGETDEE